MDGKGWKPQYGISTEGIEMLGYVEALPREVRRELVKAIATACRNQGYLSLHDDLRGVFSRAGRRERSQQYGKVIPLFRR